MTYLIAIRELMLAARQEEELNARNTRAQSPKAVTTPKQREQRKLKRLPEKEKEVAVLPEKVVVLPENVVVLPENVEVLPVNESAVLSVNKSTSVQKEMPATNPEATRDSYDYVQAAELLKKFRQEAVTPKALTQNDIEEIARKVLEDKGSFVTKSRDSSLDR